MSATVCDDVADLLDLAPDALEPDERARRAAHLDACVDCKDRAGAHALAGNALLAAADGPPPRAAVREHLLGAAEAVADDQGKPALARPAPVNEAVRVRLRCTYCLAPLQTAAAVYCADCLAPVHGPCFEEHGRCAAPGCGGTRMVEPRAARPRRSGAGRALFFATGLALVTGVAAWSRLSLEPPAAPVIAHATTEVAPPEPPAPPLPPAPVTAPALVLVAPAPPPPPPAAPTLRVLFVESSPRWEYRYLKNLLLRDPALDVQCLLLSADSDFTQEHSARVPPLEGFPSSDELRGYDLVILGDVATADLYAGAFVMVARAVSEGAGLLVIDGPLSGPAWGQTALKPVLPIHHDPDGSLPSELLVEPWRPRLTAVGRTSPLLALEADAAESEAMWSSLEPLYGYTRALSATAGSEVLLTHPTDEGPHGPRPLLAWRAYGAGRCAWLGLDETWRWRAGVGDRFMGRFYGGLVRFLARSTGGPGPMPRGCTVRLRGGAEIPTVLHSIRNVQGTPTLSTADGTWPLSALEGVAFAPGEPAAPLAGVLLASGDLLAGRISKGDELEFTLESPALGELRIPLNQVRVVALGDLGSRSLLTPGSWADAGERLSLKNGTVRLGDVLKIDDTLVRYSTPLGQEVAPLSVLDWVSLEPFPSTSPRAPTATLHLVDGSRLRATLLELNWGAVRLQHPVLDRVTVARDAVLSLRFD